MSPPRLAEVRTMAPDSADKVRQLYPLGEIPDPSGQPATVYDECASQIRAQLRQRMAELAASVSAPATEQVVVGRDLPPRGAPVPGTYRGKKTGSRLPSGLSSIGVCRSVSAMAVDFLRFPRVRSADPLALASAALGTCDGRRRGGWSLIVPPDIVRQRRALRGERVDPGRVIRVADREGAHDQAIGAEAELLAEHVRVAGDAVLRATAESTRYQAEHHVLDEEANLPKRSRHGVPGQMEDHRHGRAVEAQIDPELRSPAGRTRVKSEHAQHMHASEPGSLLGDAARCAQPVGIARRRSHAPVELSLAPGLAVAGRS